MGKINMIYYQELNDDIIDITKYNFLYNVAKYNNIFSEEYLSYEEKQIQKRNELIANAIKEKIIDKYNSINSMIVGISPIKNKAIIIISQNR